MCLMDSVISWHGIAGAQNSDFGLFKTGFLPISFHLVVLSTISQVLDTKSSPAIADSSFPSLPSLPQITAVCNFFTYIRYIQQGLVRQDGKKG